MLPEGNADDNHFDELTEQSDAMLPAPEPGRLNCIFKRICY